MIEKPLLSVLVPIYNVSRFIEKCAISLFEQDYSNIEYVFVNDCTPDDSMEVLQRVIQKYADKKVQIVNHERNRGLSAARNTAAKAATGEYVMHIDSDDYLSCNTAISELMQKLLQEQADVVIYDMQHVFTNKSVISSFDVPVDRVEYIKDILSRQTAVCVCGGVYRRSLYTQYNVWAIEGLNYGEDYVTKPRLVYYAHKVVHLKKTFYCYVHINEQSYTQNFSSIAVADQKKVLHILHDFFENKPDALLYAQALDKMDINCKAECLLAWGVGGGTKKDFYDICKIKANFWQPISLKLRIVMVLAALRMHRLLSFYAKIGVAVKQKLK